MLSNIINPQSFIKLEVHNEIKIFTKEVKSQWDKKKALRPETTIIKIKTLITTFKSKIPFSCCLMEMENLKKTQGEHLQVWMSFTNRACLGKRIDKVKLYYSNVNRSSVVFLVILLQVKLVKIGCT